MDADIVQPPIQLATTAPVPESNSAAAGVIQQAARTDHVHPRLSATNIDTTDANGLRTLTFTRSFSAEPSPVFTLIEAGTTAPVAFRVQSWVMAGPAYTGCIVYGQRQRALPAVIALLGTLTNYEPWVPAANVRFSSIMIASSQP